MKYAWIENHTVSFTIKLMCKVIGVSASGFYAARRSEPSQCKQRKERLHHDVAKIHNESNHIYGSYKIAEELQSDSQLQSACRNTVAKAMQEMGLKSRVSKRFKPTTTVFPGHLN